MRKILFCCFVCGWILCNKKKIRLFYNGFVSGLSTLFLLEQRMRVRPDKNEQMGELMGLTLSVFVIFFILYYFLF